MALGSSLLGGGDLPDSKLRVVDGCLCCNTSLFLEVPECLGCSGECELLFCKGSCCCRPNTSQQRFICFDVRKKSNELKVKVRKHVFCCVADCALPPRVVPCTLAKFGIAVYPRVGCCLTLAQLSMTRL